MIRIISIKVFFLILLFVYSGMASAQGDKGGKDKLIKKAHEYFFSGKYEMAELLLKDVLNKYPEHQPAYSYLGDIQLKKRHLNLALQYYQKALELNPKSSEDFFRIGQVYYYKKKGLQAIDNFKKALELDSKLTYAYYHIGLTHLIILRNKENTIQNWEKYLIAAPQDPQYEKIRRAIELLRDPNFKIPPVGSDISIEEALHLGGSVLKKGKHSSRDKKAGHEKKKTKNKIEDIQRDDDL